jgi:hypothetical protein
VIGEPMGRYALEIKTLGLLGPLVRLTPYRIPNIQSLPVWHPRYIFSVMALVRHNSYVLPGLVNILACSNDYEKVS